MQFNCPKCRQTLSVRDELLGRKIKCPTCQTVLRLKAPAQQAAPPPEAPQPAAPPEPGGLRLADEPAPSGLRLADEPAQQAGPQMGFTPGDRPVCYLTKDNDQLRAVTRIFSKLREVLPGEGLDFQFTDYGLRYSGPPELRPQDIQVTGGVDHCDYGSRSIRYFFTLFSLAFGWGACKLDVSGELRRGDGSADDIQIKVRQGLGIFGGSDERLMEANVKAAENGFAAQVAKKLTGRWITNLGAQTLAKAALVLGLFGLIPGLGLVLFLPTLIAGGIAAGTLLSRGVSKGKTMAVIGTVLGVLDFAISIGLMLNAD